MALPKQRAELGDQQEENKRSGERIKALFMRMSEALPTGREDEEWEQLKKLMNEGRNEENKLFREDE